MKRQTSERSNSATTEGGRTGTVSRGEKGTLAGARYFQRVQHMGCPEKDTQEDTAGRRLKVFPRRKRSGWPRASDLTWLQWAQTASWTASGCWRGSGATR